MAAAKFITFEGGEGSGKSTQARRLAERLRTQGTTVLETREPGGSPFAERLRALMLDPNVEPHGALPEALLFYAARSDHLDRAIRPALARGEWVVCDRFHDSTRVYQGYAGALDDGIFQALDLLVVRSTRPDLTLIVDVPVEIGLARATVRRTGALDLEPERDTNGARTPRGLIADRYEARDLAFHQRLKAGYLKIAANDPERCIVIDGQRPVDDVADAIWAAVSKRLLAKAE